ncbi:MAG TPA: glycosyltransferase family 4 protein, partial [Terriglobales bacterium]|nr:glycosyltransferase family 4 protein [Terriglobales bacterium]
KSPLLISVWGNDFTLHARSNPLMAAATRRAMHRADALHADTQRDQLLAGEWGFAADRPSLVLPGNGGVRGEIFKPSEKQNEFQVVNPRGVRAYVRNDVFFRAIPLVLAKIPSAHFVCPGMAHEPEAQRWIDQLKISSSVELLPKLDPKAMASAFQDSQVSVSPSTHDGTPNTLLEAMACGCFPVASDLESIREWIKSGENGLLVDPNYVEGVAGAIVRGLRDAKLRTSAAKINLKLIQGRANFSTNMAKVEQFYKTLLNKK